MDTVGEMTIVSTLPRTANLVVSTPVSGMIVGKGVLEGLFENEPVLGIKLLRNIVANKLAETNKVLAARISNEGQT